jgi:hypothetical protein
MNLRIYTEIDFIFSTLHGKRVKIGQGEQQAYLGHNLREMGTGLFKTRYSHLKTPKQ